MKPIEFKFAVTLRDILYNASSDCIRDGDDARYGRGVLVGVVGAIMGVTGCQFKEAVSAVRGLATHPFDPRAIPDAWKADFES